MFVVDGFGRRGDHVTYPVEIAQQHVEVGEHEVRVGGHAGGHYAISVGIETLAPGIETLNPSGPRTSQRGEQHHTRVARATPMDDHTVDDDELVVELERHDDRPALSGIRRGAAQLTQCSNATAGRYAGPACGDSAFCKA